MNKEQQLNSDKEVLASLEAEYKRAQRVIYSIRALVTDLNFEELIPDSQERCLMVDELQAYDYIRTNLMNRIRFYRARVKREESIKDWTQDKKTDSTHICVDVSDEGDHGACSQVCGDDIATNHCGRDECNRSGLMTLKEMVNDYVERCDENGRLKIDHNHCGQDASCPVGGGCATVQDPNESQPADTRVSLNDLLGMEVISVGGMPCDACNPDNYAGRPCVKVELVGGHMLCLAPRPNSIITE